MNATEFDRFKGELFVRYPSLYEWLCEKSPDARATLQSWHRRLAAESLEDCMAVLDEWERGNKEPFKAYERDQVPSVVKSVIARQRDRQRKEEIEREQAELARHYCESRRARHGEAEKVAGSLDADSRAAMEWLQPFHRQMLDGEMSGLDYQVKKEEAWERFFNGATGPSQIECEDGSFA